MSTNSSPPILSWIVNAFLATLYFIKCLFKSSASEEVLPVASPVPPSTPSFIQTYEPNMSADAMKVFQLNSGQPRASRVARHQMAMAEARKGHPSSHWSQYSASPTDPSPGFSLLSLVPDNLAPVSGESDSASMYSTPPPSPCPSMNTPSIVVSNTYGEFPPVHDDVEPETFIMQEVRTIPPRQSAEEDRAAPQFLPSVNDLAKRRLKFKGPPIVTDIPKDLCIPSHPTTPVKGLQEEEEVDNPHFLSPKAAYFAVTEFVRSSTPLGSPTKSDKRRASQQSNLASPECQDVFSAHSPFSTYSDSFYVDDHVPSSQMVDADINNISFYSDFESTLNLSTMRRKRTRLSHVPSTIPSTIEEDPFEAPQESRSVSAYSQVSGVDYSLDSPLASPLCKLTQLPNFLPEISLAEIPDSDLTDCHEYPPSTLPATSEYPSPVDPDTLARLALHASTILPFELEDGVPLDDCPDVKPSSKATGKLYSRSRPVPKISQGIYFVARDSVPLAKAAVSAFKHQVTVDHTAVCERTFAPSEQSSSLLAPDLTTDRAQTPPPSSSKLLGPVAQISPLSMKKTRTRNRSATIVQPSGSLEACNDNFVQLPPPSPSLKRNPVAVSGSACPPLDPTSPLKARAIGSLSPMMALSPVESVSSVDSILASPASPSEIYSPSVVGSSGNLEAREFPKFGLIPGGVEAILQGEVTEVKSGVVPVGKARSRRIGIYGSLPHQMTKTLGQELPAINVERTSVGLRDDTSVPPIPRGSKRESGLRPLVLPMHVAKRESLNTTSPRPPRPSQADSSQVTTRSSIGLPPSQPLPAVPGGERSKKKVNKSGSEVERLNKLIDLLDAIDLPREDDRKYRSNRRQVETSSWSPDESDEECDHASDDGSHVSWGIAL